MQNGAEGAMLQTMTDGHVRVMCVCVFCVGNIRSGIIVIVTIQVKRGLHMHICVFVHACMQNRTSVYNGRKKKH